MSFEYGVQFGAGLRMGGGTGDDYYGGGVYFPNGAEITEVQLPPGSVLTTSSGRAYPLSQTPLRYLLADRIDLMRDTNVVAVQSDDVFVTVVIEESQPLIGTSRLMMMVGAKDYQLKQWTVTDPQGYDTTVAVSNLDTRTRPDPNMFTIVYDRNMQ